MLTVGQFMRQILWLAGADIWMSQNIHNSGKLLVHEMKSQILLHDVSSKIRDTEMAIARSDWFYCSVTQYDVAVCQHAL